MMVAMASEHRTAEVELAPSTSSRATFVGTTQFGKTTLALAFLALVRRPGARVCAIDTKGDAALNAFATARGYFRSQLPVVPSAAQPRVLLHVPPDPDALQPLFHRLVADGDVLVYIDELTHVTKPSGNQAGLRSLYATGAGRGVGVWACSQQPVFIPSIILSSSDRLFVFRLKRRADRDTVAGYIGEAAERTASFEPGRFLYHDDRVDEPIECEPIPLAPSGARAARGARILA